MLFSLRKRKRKQDNNWVCGIWIHHWLNPRMKKSGESEDFQLKMRISLAASVSASAEFWMGCRCVDNHIIQNSKTNFPSGCSQCHTLETLFLLWKCHIVVWFQNQPFCKSLEITDCSMRNHHGLDIHGRQWGPFFLGPGGGQQWRNRQNIRMLQ